MKYNDKGFDVMAQIINNSGGIIPKTTSDMKNSRNTKVEGRSNEICSFSPDKSR